MVKPEKNNEEFSLWHLGFIIIIIFAVCGFVTVVFGVLHSEPISNIMGKDTIPPTLPPRQDPGSLVAPGKNISDYTLVGDKPLKTGDFVITTDEFNVKHGVSFFGYIVNSEVMWLNIRKYDNHHEDIVYYSFEGTEYDLVNEVRKINGELTDDVVLYRVNNHPAKASVYSRYLFNYYPHNLRNNIFKYSLETERYLFMNRDISAEDGQGGMKDVSYIPKPFKVVNETEFMSKFEVVEYDKVWS